MGEFSSAVKNLREKYGLSQGALAALIGVAPSLPSHWERGIRGVTPEVYWRVLSAARRAGSPALAELLELMSATLTARRA